MFGGGRCSLADLEGTGRSVRVPMRRGQDALAELRLRPTKVKMDVEGAEPLVLSGLGYHPSILLFEFSPSQLSAMGYSGNEFLESLVTYGYDLKRIDPNNGTLTPILPASSISDLSHSRLPHWNILAVR